MRRDKHYTLARELAEQVAEAHALPGVKAARRLVQYEHFRVVEHGLSYADAALRAAGQLLNFVLVNPGEREDFAQFLNLFARRSLLQALERGHVFEVVGHGEFGVKTEVLRQIAEHIAPRLAQRERVRAVAEHAARGGREYAREHAHERGLARAVCADEAPNAAREREAHVVHGGLLPKAFCQVLYFNFHNQAPFQAYSRRASRGTRRQARRARRDRLLRPQAEIGSAAPR